MRRLPTSRQVTVIVSATSWPFSHGEAINSGEIAGETSALQNRFKKNNTGDSQVLPHSGMIRRRMASQPRPRPDLHLEDEALLLWNKFREAWRDSPLHFIAIE